MEPDADANSMDFRSAAYQKRLAANREFLKKAEAAGVRVPLVDDDTDDDNHSESA